MATESLLIGLSVAVLVSYWFLHLGRVWRFPAVVFLLFAGIALRQFTDWRGISVPLPTGLLPLLGTVGLILIVLEGALDLDLQPGRRRFLLRTFGAAAFGLAITTAAIAVGVHYGFGVPWLSAALMGIPFGVISSAVAIPSAAAMGRDDREFVTYESSWSDILGVMAFNALLLAAAFGDDSRAGSQLATLNFFGGGVAVLAIGSVVGLAVYWLVGHLEGHVKFVPLLFALILVYAGAKALHLSPLLIVLVLGLMLNNPHLLRHLRWLDRLHSDHYDAELGKLKHLTAETTFLVRTFFFLVLGFTTDLGSLVAPRTWAIASALVLAIFVLRWLVLRSLGDGHTRPLVWTAPRGLITVLLFMSLPAGTVPAGFPPGALILVVLLSCIVMAAGMRLDTRAPAAADPAPPEPEVAPATGGSPGSRGD